MGRPRKDAGAAEAEQVEQVEERLESYELKPCPKCDEPARQPYKDAHGNWRCNCSHPKCGFWDSMVYMSPEAAAAGWNAAGGPNRI